MIKFIERIKLNYKICKFKIDCSYRVHNTLTTKCIDWAEFKKMKPARDIATKINAENKAIKYIPVFGSNKKAKEKLDNYRKRLKNIQELGKELNN